MEDINQDLFKKYEAMILKQRESTRKYRSKNKEELNKKQREKYYIKRNEVPPSERCYQKYQTEEERHIARNRKARENYRIRQEKIKQLLKDAQDIKDSQIQKEEQKTDGNTE